MMRKYDDQFKREAVKKNLDGQSAASVARELSVNESQLGEHKKAGEIFDNLMLR